MSTFRVTESDGPIITTAIHAGHDLHPEVLEVMRLSDEDRLREEDPFTEHLANIGVTEVVVSRSRFEVDMNRPRETCVYRTPDDAWGLDVWREGAPSPDTVERALAQYDGFYTAMHDLFTRKQDRDGGFVVLDVHSYNHRRGGPDAQTAPLDGNPEVNLGTGTLDRARWAPVIDVFLRGMRDAGFDARENVKFKGGAFAGWTHHEFSRRGCVLAVEFKKTFMDEWTGVADVARIERGASALRGLVPALEDALIEVLRGSSA